METKARYFMVGVFVLGSIAAMVGFVVWLSAFGSQVRYVPYFVRFEGSVSQLSGNSTVLFGGIPVGRVTDLGIDLDNSELARVDIEIRTGTPVRTDSVASLEVQSLAGGVVMQISRGSREVPLLAPGSEITGVPSTLEKLARQIPDLLAKVEVLASQAEKFLSDENAAKLSATLDNVHRMSGEIATCTESIDEEAINRALANADAALVSVGEAADRMSALANSLNDATGELKGGVADATSGISNATDEVAAMAQSIGESSKKLAAILEENREPLKQFSGTVLYEASELVAEMRRLVQSLTRISHQIEKDPARFLLGDRAKGVETP
jgi:phospholipid/cholesterol/gamma-HCH transport system substrate-binding protein